MEGILRKIRSNVSNFMDTNNVDDKLLLDCVYWFAKYTTSHINIQDFIKWKEDVENEH